MYRCFKQELGITPIEFINEQRISAAKLMLETQNVSVTEIALACGFNNINYFFRIFKKITGYTPVQYRNQEKGALSI